MSIHKSLKGSTKIVKKRNVLKRFERLDILREKGTISENKIQGLPKTKINL